MDYKKYSLEHLENWLYDAMSCDDATPQEIYDVILKVVKDEYYTYKKKASESYELLALLSGNGKGHIKEYDDCVDKILSCDKDDSSLECKSAWNDFWEDTDSSREFNLREAEYYNKRAELDLKQDKVVKWQLPVEVDGLTGECFVQFPDDLLEAANLKEGDTVNWIDRGDGSFELRKVNAK
jgi:hypothetical protein